MIPIYEVVTALDAEEATWLKAKMQTVPGTSECFASDADQAIVNPHQLDGPTRKRLFLGIWAPSYPENRHQAHDHYPTEPECNNLTCIACRITNKLHLSAWSMDGELHPKPLKAGHKAKWVNT